MKKLVYNHDLGFLKRAVTNTERSQCHEIERAYDFLPVVIYTGTGTKLIQCNHGGMESGFNPEKLSHPQAY